jgi:hypothetical protein
MEVLTDIGEVTKGIWTIMLFAIGLLGYYYYAKIWYPYYLGPLKNLPRPKSGVWHYYKYMYNHLKAIPSIT